MIGSRPDSMTWWFLPEYYVNLFESLDSLLVAFALPVPVDNVLMRYYVYCTPYVVL
jgi:hypothetical protein